MQAIKRILGYANNSPTRKKQEKEAKETREDPLKASKDLRQKIANLEKEKTQLTEEIKKLIEAGEAEATALAKEIEELREEIGSLRKLLGTSNTSHHSQR